MSEELVVPSETIVVEEKKSRVPLIIGIGMIAIASIVGIYFLWPMIFKKKPYECMFCDASFETRAELCEHISTEHSDKELPSYCISSNGGNGDGQIHGDPFSASITSGTINLPPKNIIHDAIGCAGTYNLTTDFEIVVRDLYGNVCPNTEVAITGSPTNIASFNVSYDKHCAEWYLGGCTTDCWHTVKSRTDATSSYPMYVTTDSNGKIKGQVGAVSPDTGAFTITVYYGGLQIGASPVQVSWSPT